VCWVHSPPWWLLLTLAPAHATAACRYKPEKLMEHLKLFATRLNVPQLIRVCEELELWKELTFLYVAVSPRTALLQVSSQGL
jgi:hypothetical protein